MEKINNNFLNDDFFKALLKAYQFDENLEEDRQTLFDKFLEFANECYIHGVTVGIKVAVEIYEENNRK